MKTEKKKGFKRIVYRFVRWLKSSYNFLNPPRIDADLGGKR